MATALLFKIVKLCCVELNRVEPIPMAIFIKTIHHRTHFWPFSNGLSTMPIYTIHMLVCSMHAFIDSNAINKEHSAKYRAHAYKYQYICVCLLYRFIDAKCFLLLLLLAVLELYPVNTGYQRTILCLMKIKLSVSRKIVRIASLLCTIMSTIYKNINIDTKMT